MSKAWGVPIHDPQIDDLNHLQLLLYQALINNDRERDVRDSRDHVEYSMAFMKPEVLSKLIRDRETGIHTARSAQDPVFMKQVQDRFGKPLSIKGVAQPEQDHDTIRLSASKK